MNYYFKILYQSELNWNQVLFVQMEVEPVKQSLCDCGDWECILDCDALWGAPEPDILLDDVASAVFRSCIPGVKIIDLVEQVYNFDDVDQSKLHII